MMNFFKVLSTAKWLAFACISGFVLNHIAYFPGFLSPDSFEQYRQSLSGHYNTWHPPVMAVLWGILNKVHDGTLLILSFQLMLLWVGVYILSISVKSKLWHVLILMFGLAPFVQNFAGYIIKDIHMAYAWLLAFAIMFRVYVSGRRIKAAEAILCLLLIVYGSWVRVNALPGAVSLCFMFCRLVFTKKNNYSILLFSVLLTACIKIGNRVFDNNILKAENGHIEAVMYMQDITGIYARTGNNFYPEYLNKASFFDSVTIRNSYNPATFDHLWWDKNGKTKYAVANENEMYELRLAWVKAISTYPLIYLKNRFNGFMYYLRIKNSGYYLYYHYADIYPNPNFLGLKFRANIISKIFIKPFDWQGSMFYFRPWFWCLLNLVLFLFIGAFRNPGCKLSYTALLLSSLLYFLPSFFIFQTDNSFRYFYWNCMACSIAVCILLVDRFYFVNNEPNINLQEI